MEGPALRLGDGCDQELLAARTETSLAKRESHAIKERDHAHFPLIAGLTMTVLVIAPGIGLLRHAWMRNDKADSLIELEAFRLPE